MGTYQYMSPERLMNKPYTANSDIWAVGLILYELVCGEYLFKE